MRRMDFTYPSSDGRTQIHAIKWEPGRNPRAIVQLVHGMIEFVERYDNFASYLADRGIMVVANDHLGHGGSVVTKSDLGYFAEDGNKCVIRDIHELRRITQENFPDKPYMMLGHSMGSFLVRQYLVESDSRLGIGDSEVPYAEGLSGAVVMGTGWQADITLGLAKMIARLAGMKNGWRAKNNTLDKLTLGASNKRIKKPRTRNDWLTKDRAIVDAYCNEPLNNFRFSNNAYYSMFTGMEVCQDVKLMKRLPAGLPLFFVSGSEDPVGAYGASVRKAYAIYNENTECKVSMKLYEGDRHEILNETDRAAVYKDMFDFFEKCIAAAADDEEK